MILALLGTILLVVSTPCLMLTAGYAAIVGRAWKPLLYSAGAFLLSILMIYGAHRA